MGRWPCRHENVEHLGEDEVMGIVRIPENAECMPTDPA